MRSPAEVPENCSHSSTVISTDPSVGTAAFPVVRGPDYHTVVFPERRGFLDYHIVEAQQLVVLVDLTWP
jgi:hypothetical protein